MSPGQALGSVLGNYADFGGRASRSEYWWWVGWYLLGYVVAIGLVAFFRPLGPLGLVLLIAMLVAVLLIWIPNLAVTVRRLHDTGHSGWWLLIGAIPAVGGLLLLVFLMLDSEPRSNRWGPPPPGSAYEDPATWISPDEGTEPQEQIPGSPQAASYLKVYRGTRDQAEYQYELDAPRHALDGYLPTDRTWNETPTSDASAMASITRSMSGLGAGPRGELVVTYAMEDESPTERDD